MPIAPHAGLFMNVISASARPMLAAALILAAAVGPGAAGAGNDEPADAFDFGAVEAGQSPPGWQTSPEGYRAVIEPDGGPDGAPCLVLDASDEDGGAFGQAVVTLDAEPYRGQRVRLTASVRVEPEMRGQLMVRVDREGGGAGFYDNMADRPVRHDDWREYEIIGTVDDDGWLIDLGVIAVGRGAVRIANVSFEAIGEAGAGNEPPRPLTPEGMRNLTAIAKLIGYARYFHPADEAAAAPWDMLTIEAVRRAEDAADRESLIDAMESIIAPYAPTIRIGVGDPPDPPPADHLRPDDVEPDGWTAWRHRGLGRDDADPDEDLFVSRRITGSLDQSIDDWNVPGPGEVRVYALGDDLWCALPLTLYTHDGRTLPHGDAPDQLTTDRPVGWSPSGHDRATRLANVIMTWNVLTHFHPYRDRFEGEWDDVLTTALNEAAVGEGETALVDALRRMLFVLDDGLGRVDHPSIERGFSLPLEWTLLANQLIVRDAQLPVDQDIEIGSMVQMIDGEPIAPRVAALQAQIPAATEHGRLARIEHALRIGGPGEAELTVVSTNSGRQTHAVEREPRNPALREVEGWMRQPHDPIEEIRPGVWLINLIWVSESQFEDALDDLAEADGLIFDLRGSSRRAPLEIIGHLIDDPVRSAQLRTPIVMRPDGDRDRFERTQWTIEPREPRLTDNVVYITNAHAIGAAETRLAVIADHDLAAIVGGPTAGAAGHANTIELPGDYRVRWTGMRAVHPDGSRIDFAGVQPTDPVEPTIDALMQGRDELLDRAIELLRH